MKHKKFKLVAITLFMALSVVTLSSCDKDGDKNEVTLEQAYESLLGKRFVYDDFEVVTMPSQEVLDEWHSLMERGYNLYVEDDWVDRIDTIWAVNPVFDKDGNITNYTDVPSINVDFKGCWSALAKNSSTSSLYVPSASYSSSLYEAAVCPFYIEIKSRDTLTVEMRTEVWDEKVDLQNIKFCLFNFHYTLEKRDDDQFAILVDDSKELSELAQNENEKMLNVDLGYNSDMEFNIRGLKGKRLLTAPYTPIVYDYYKKLITYDRDSKWEVLGTGKDVKSNARLKTKLKPE